MMGQETICCNVFLYHVYRNFGLQIVIVLSVMIYCPSSYGKIIRVSQSGNGSDGISWATAYQSISVAVSSASTGDEIWVNRGTYSGGIFVEINVSLLGGFSGNETDSEKGLRDPVKNPTIVNGGGVVDGLMGCVSNSFIDGFIMKDAASAGLLVYNGASPNFLRCRIEGNYPTEGVTFGGGVVVNNAAPNFSDCVIINNNRNGGGGGIEIKEYSTVNMTNCTISNNVSSGGVGGGIACGLSSITMENCIVTNNRAYSTASEEPVSNGGGIVFGRSSVGVITNSIIANNWATVNRQIDMGGIEEPLVSLNNCTIIGSMAGDVNWSDLPPTIMNCIFWGANGILTGEQGDADISFSCIQGGYSGFGNISDDPLFRDAANGDYRLQPLSPCIDTAGTSGPSDDLNGNPRPVEIAGIGRDATDTYDMGAYEFQLNELPTPSQVDPEHTELYQ